MALLGHNPLQARSAYQPIIHQQGSRWIAYIGHHGGSAFNPLTNAVENNGVSIVDVTKPAIPFISIISRVPAEQVKQVARRWCGFVMARTCLVLPLQM